MEKKLKEFVGHTPSQVMAGMLLGIVVAVVYFYVVL
jgi:acid phosphatase family membrane protein YuiD